MERGDSFHKVCYYMQEFILELAPGDFRIVNFNEEVGEKESDEYAKTTPNINSGATDGGILSG